jgi:hypothetical protein
MMRSTRPSVFLVGAAVVVALTGCTAGSNPTAGVSSRAAAPSSRASVPRSSGTPSPGVGPSETSSSPSCGPSTGQAAAAKGIAALPAPTNLTGIRWDALGAEYAGYSPCTALSWSIITVQGSTASSPYAILLFHHGSYLGTATKIACPSHPDVTRTTDNTVHVTYHYPKAGENDADLTGTTNVTLNWDANAHKVQFDGSTPPVS